MGEQEGGLLVEALPLNEASRYVLIFVLSTHKSKSVPVFYRYACRYIDTTW